MIGAGYTGGYQPKVPTIETKEKFAWRPIRTKSGKWIWWCKYIKFIRKYWGPSGEGPAVYSDCYTENEWLLEEIKSPKKDPIPSSGKSGYY